MAPRFVLPLLPLLSALSGLMSAQTPADSALAADSARLLFQQAFSAYQEGSAPALTRALQLWNRSLTHFRRARHRAEEGAALTWIGGLHDALGRPDSALVYYGRALVTLREVGDLRGEGLALNDLGTVYDALGRRDSALAYYGQALVIRRQVGDRRGEGRTLHNLGHLYAVLGRRDSALAYYGRALVTLREVGDLRGEGLTLSGVGGVYGDLGQPDSALAYHKWALGVLWAVGDRRGEGVALDDLGRVYATLGRADSALVYYGRALVITREVGDRRGEGGMLHNIGTAYRELRRPDSALAYYGQALAIASEVGDRQGEGVTLQKRGQVYVDLGWPDSALAYYTKSLAIRQEVGDRPGEGATLNGLGRAYAVLGQPDSALAYYGRALAVVREVGDRQGEGVVLGNMGDLHRSRPSNLPAAAAYYDSAAVARAAVAERAGADPNRLSFAERGVDLFEGWALTWLARAPEVGAERAGLAALAAAERGRAQALLDLIRVTSAQARAVPGTAAATARGADLVANVQSVLAPLRRARITALCYLVTSDTLVIWLALPSGALQVVRRPIGRVRLDTLIAALRASIWADSARPGGQARGDAALESDPALLRSTTVDSLVRQGPDSLLKYVATLLLPREFLDELPQGVELVIVPHSILGLVPFAALPSDAAGMPLGIKHALRYTPSLATLGAVEARASPLGRGAARQTALRRALVVGDPAMPPDPDHPDTRFLPLDQARLESGWLAHVLGVRLLNDSAASETVVRRRLSRATLVHLATHGRAYNSDAFARASFVVLAPDRRHPDGLLTVGELLDDSTLTLHEAELVVLSACQTGLGDLKEAEGTVGLQRAFLAKGARSVLVSLWSVREDATRLLMEKFYTYWLDERDPVTKANALRRAQDDVRAMPRFRAPYFWAGFQLVGAR